MKYLLLLLLPFSSFYSQTNNNFEIFFSPFQTRIGGLEYDINKVNEEGESLLRTEVNTFQVNDIEIGVNYLFCIKDSEFGVGLSYFTDSYNFSVYTKDFDRFYKINKHGISLNAFYRKQLFANTTIDLGLNTRFNLYTNFNQNDHSNNILIDFTDYESKEFWISEFPIQLLPSIHFNTEIYKGIYLKYGVYTKFWGKDFYNGNMNRISNPDEVFLDFSAKSNSLKATISLGYKFNN